MLRPIVFLFVVTCIHVSALTAQEAPDNAPPAEPNAAQKSQEPAGSDSNVADAETTTPPKGEPTKATEKEPFDWLKFGSLVVGAGTFVLAALIYCTRQRVEKRVETVKRKADKEFEEREKWQESQTLEDPYKKALREELGTVKMLGSPDVPNVPVDLLDTFVSLDITAMSAGEYREGLEANQTRIEADRKLSPESALKRAFERHRMLLVLGDPGSGKTTLLKYYAMLCLKDRHAELGLDEPALPIYLPLREIESKDGELCPLHECLAKWATRNYLKTSADTFFGWLKNRRTLILLDGLDEISNLDRRQEICKWLDSATTGLTKARFVVTSRWTGYRKADGIELEFEHAKADVRDFSPQQQAEFLNKWFVAAYLREPNDEKLPEQQWQDTQRQRALDRAKAIVEFLAEDDNKGVRELAVVPMLLQVIAILWRERRLAQSGRRPG